MTITSYTTNGGFFHKKDKLEKSTAPSEYYNEIAISKYPELKNRLDEIKNIYVQYLDMTPLTKEEEELEYVQRLVKINNISIKSSEYFRQSRAIDRLSMDRKIPKEIIALIKDSVNENKEYKELLTLPLYIKALTYFKLIK